LLLLLQVQSILDFGFWILDWGRTTGDN